jgi:NADPH:quinone reductase-like Zn-dependent oxidoreductase
MRAVVCDRYGPPDVLRIEEVPRPVPKPDELLVRVSATTVNRTDYGVRAGEPAVSRLISGFRRPKWRILGTELAGTVEATGTAVTQFAVGDEVFGVNAWHFGAHAEFVCMRERGPLARKPNGTSFGDAAAVCDGAILATDHLENVPLALWTSRVGDKKVVFPVPPRYTKQDVLFLKQLIEEGKYRAVIDRSYPLEDVVDATRYVETKQKTGNVLLTID